MRAGTGRGRPGVEIMQIEGYETGMVRLYEPKCAAECYGYDHVEGDCGKYHSSEFTGKAFLPHSCQEWIIGDPEQVEALIADLQKLLEQMRPPTIYTVKVSNQSQTVASGYLPRPKPERADGN